MVFMFLMKTMLRIYKFLDKNCRLSYDKHITQIKLKYYPDHQDPSQFILPQQEPSTQMIFLLHGQLQATFKVIQSTFLF